MVSMCTSCTRWGLDRIILESSFIVLRNFQVAERDSWRDQLQKGIRGEIKDISSLEQL